MRKSRRHAHLSCTDLELRIHDFQSTSRVFSLRCSPEACIRLQIKTFLSPRECTGMGGEGGISYVSHSTMRMRCASLGSSTSRQVTRDTSLLYRGSWMLGRRLEEIVNWRNYLYQDATKCVLRVFTNLSRTLLAWRRSFSRTALVPGSSQSSSALEQQLFKDTSKLVREQVFTARRTSINFRLGFACSFLSNQFHRVDFFFFFFTSFTFIYVHLFSPSPSLHTPRERLAARGHVY